MTSILPAPAKTSITLQEFLDLKDSLEAMVLEHKRTAEGMDANYICVIAPKYNGLIANHVFSTKDPHWGWIFFSASTDSCGTELAHKIHELVTPFGLITKERQL